jgi:hypothetical protein
MRTFINITVDGFNPMLRFSTIFPYSMTENFSTAQFLTVIIAIAVGITGWVTALLTNRRWHAEQAMLVIREIKSVPWGGYKFVIENVGIRAALNVSTGDGTVVSGGLRSGEQVTVKLRGARPIDLFFRDADGTECHLREVIGFAGGIPYIAPAPNPDAMRRIFIKTGLLAAGRY